MRRAILCVDDEAVILLSLKFLLKGAFGNEYRIETAYGADEALRLLEGAAREEVEYRLLVTDWLMPGRKGDELIRAARGLVPGLPCILITGQAEESVLSSLVQENLVRSIFRKPWNEQELLDAVRGCLHESA
ncbi:MAG: response regulator [Treponema sp.]|nr:response regulator [Treponema sp.]